MTDISGDLADTLHKLVDVAAGTRARFTADDAGQAHEAIAAAAEPAAEDLAEPAADPESGELADTAAELADHAPAAEPQEEVADGGETD